jgi:hypothetical protein
MQKRLNVGSNLNGAKPKRQPLHGSDWRKVDLDG